jgi:hypothetical protein
MTDEHDRTQPAGGWRPPQPASEATFVPPPAPAAQQGWPPPPATDPAAAPSWPPAVSGTPSWPPPPAGYEQAAGWPTAPAAPRSTSILVVVAAVFLLVAGLLLLGMSALLLLGSALFAGAEGVAELEGMVGAELAGALAGIFAAVGVVALLASVLQVVGAFGMLARRSWGRAIGLVVGVLGLLFWGLSFVAALGAPADAGSSLAFTGVFVAGYALTIVALVTGGAHFRRG